MNQWQYDYADGRNGLTAAEVAAEIRGRDAIRRGAGTRSTTPAPQPIRENAGALRHVPPVVGKPESDLGEELAAELDRQADEQIAELLAENPDDAPAFKIDIDVPEGLRSYAARGGKG